MNIPFIQPQQPSRPKGNLVDRFVRKQLLKHAVPLAAAGTGLAAGGFGLGYLKGENSAYKDIYQNSDININLPMDANYSQSFSYMVEFGFVPPKLHKLRKGVSRGMESIAQSGKLVSGDSAVRKQTLNRLNKLKTLKQEYA